MVNDTQPVTKPEDPPLCGSVAEVVVIELFAGILPATAALHKLNVRAVSFFSETANDPLDLAARNWPTAIPIGDAELLGQQEVQDIVRRHPRALIWLTGGIPCKDVSFLKQGRKGAEGNQSRKYRLAVKVLGFLMSMQANYVFTFECTRMRQEGMSVLRCVRSRTSGN